MANKQEIPSIDELSKYLRIPKSTVYKLSQEEKSQPKKSAGTDVFGKRL